MDSGTSIRASRAGWVTLGLGMALFALILLRTAWLSDDAYITFRSIDNFLHGHGLRWNAAERVQPFTHPLWMMAVTASVALSGEFYVTAISLAMATSLAAVGVLVFAIARNATAGALALAVLTMSRAYVDFSTSGLEDPLTHLLLGVFTLVYLRGDCGASGLFRLALVGALAATNRMDCVLLVLPALAVRLWANRSGRALLAVAAGFLPLALWLGFSLVYYGFPFPNSAYAKLDPGIDPGLLARRGLLYLEDSLRGDPVTLVAIAAASATVFVRRAGSLVPLVVGIVLYGVYVVRIGGDFMSGRHLTAPLFLAMVLLARIPMRAPSIPAAVSFALVVGLGFLGREPPILSGADFGLDPDRVMGEGRIADERQFYYPITGLRRAVKHPIENYRWAREGRALRADESSVSKTYTVGLTGFYAGPGPHIIDLAGVADPLLARLPAVPREEWRVGHYWRAVPAGYEKALRGDDGGWKDSELACYYAHLKRVTRGPLFERDRWRSMWYLNRGRGYEGACRWQRAPDSERDVSTSRRP